MLDRERPRERAATPVSKAWASTPSPIRSSLIGARLAPPAATRGRRDRAPPPRGTLQPAPRPTTNVDRDKACRSSGDDVVLDSIPDIRQLARVALGELDDALEEPRIGLPDAEALGGRDDICRQPGGPCPALHRGGLVADDADAQPECRNRLEACKGVRVEVAELVRDVRNPGGGRSIPRWLQSRLWSSPRSIVTPSAAQITWG